MKALTAGQPWCLASRLCRPWHSLREKPTSIDSHLKLFCIDLWAAADFLVRVLARLEADLQVRKAFVMEWLIAAEYFISMVCSAS